MFQFQNIWLPEGEKHFPEWMQKNGEMVDGRGTYQIRKIRALLEHCKNFRTAIDVGAHVGLWSMHLAKRFTSVYAFEPVTAFRRCFIRNTAHLQNIVLFPYALGAQKREHVAMKIDPADSGGTHVGSEAGDIQMVQLDSIDYPAMVDCIKIDCEGYELEILKGARRTLEQFRPTVIVEQKPHKLGPNFGIKGTPAVDYLIAMGGSVRKEIGGDYILGF